jgi:hypothetical protein
MLFYLFLAGTFLHTYFLVRFVRVVSEKKALSDKDIEALGQLILSGAGGMAEQWRMLVFLLTRGYLALDDPDIVRAGNRAWGSFWFALLLLVIWGGLATWGDTAPH